MRLPTLFIQFLLTFCLIAGLVMGCVHEAPPPATNAFDGMWTSAQLDYDIALSGMIGLAERTRAKGIQDGDPVLRLSAMEGKRVTARQWLPDGQWHTVTLEQVTDGTVTGSDGVRSWTLRRKDARTP